MPDCQDHAVIVDPNPHSSADTKLTSKQLSVACNLAMAQRDGAVGKLASSALAASRTMSRDVTSCVAISAIINCKY